MDWAVSVIVPFYNAAPWLERCLKSLLAQYLRELEIILVDDASTDASPKIAERYTGRYPDRIRYLRQESNMGPGAARNVGLSLARGEYVGFVDADDMAEPEMFSSLYATARKTGAQVAVCGIYLSRDGREHEILPGYICDAQNLFKNVRLFPSPCNKIFQRNYLIMWNFDGTIEEDETMVWDWSNGAHHLPMPNGAFYDDNGGNMFVFPEMK